MAIVQTQNLSNGRLVHLASGSFTDDAASPAAYSVDIGFRPRYICFEDVTDRIKFEWYEGMALTNTIKTVAAGTRTLDTSSAIVVPAGTSGGAFASTGLENSPPGTQPGGTITFAAAVVLQNKLNTWRAHD